MKVALLFGRMCLAFRKSIDFDGLREDPRGLTGSEWGLVRIAECLAMKGHKVEIFTVSSSTEYQVPKAPGATFSPTIGIRSIDESLSIDESYDAAISINEPDLLRVVRAKRRVCEFWLNEFSFCKAGFENHVDAFTSPSEGHLRKVLEDWRDVEVGQEGPKARYEPDRAKWSVNLLGADPIPKAKKVPGRVIYCSSPDRGLHWLLQEWQGIKRAVPHATLKIFYRLEPWLRGFDSTPFWPSVEPQRDRARYIEEAIRRLRGWDVEVCDSVSRATLAHEMSISECLAYPCDTPSWSEGFSCSILESCAAQAAPVITDCDALPTVYGGVLPITPRGDWDAWRGNVVRVLTDAKFRDGVNAKALELAKELTWKAHTERLLRLIDGSSSPKISATKRAGSKTSSKPRARV